MAFGAGAAEQETPAALRAGFAAVPLPTPPGGPLGGYGGLRDRRARHTLDPPEARALVLDQGERRLGLVVLDIMIARPDLHRAVRTRTAALDLEPLAVVATHTHSGPGGYLSGWLAARFTGGTEDPEALDRLADAAARALRRAAEEAAPARADAALGTLELAYNRRSEDGSREDELPVVRFSFADGRDPILVFSYGAHPTLLSSRSRAYSADYPGAARAWLAARGWRPLYLPGPLGDQAAGVGVEEAEDEEEEQARVREAGMRVGRAAAEASEAAAPSTAPGALSASERWVEAPPVALRRFCPLWWVGPFVGRTLREFISVRVPLQAVRVGSAVFVALPAEPTSAIGEDLRLGLRAQAADLVPIVVAHANDWIGYTVRPERHRAGGYEACMSLHGPELGPWLVKEALETTRLLKSAAP